MYVPAARATELDDTAKEVVDPVLETKGAEVPLNAAVTALAGLMVQNSGLLVALYVSVASTPLADGDVPGVIVNCPRFALLLAATDTVGPVPAAPPAVIDGAEPDEL